jgi:hypothetical protein
MTTTAPTIKVDEFIDAEKATNEVAVNGNDLQAEFIRQPGLVYYYTSLAAKAEAQHSSLKLKLEATEAQAATNIRNKALSDGEKLTADMVKERVRLVPQVVRVEQALIKAKEVETMLKGIVEALRHKRDSLTSLGLMTRDEMKARIAVEDGYASRDQGAGSRAAAFQERLREGRS